MHHHASTLTSSWAEDVSVDRWQYISTDLASSFRQTAGVFHWYTAASGTAGNAITWVEIMRLDKDGNLLSPIHRSLSIQPDQISPKGCLGEAVR